MLPDPALQAHFSLDFTEICGIAVDRVFVATEDRFSAVSRTRDPWVDALDMASFGRRESVFRVRSGRQAGFIQLDTSPHAYNFWSEFPILTYLRVC